MIGGGQFLFPRIGNFVGGFGQTSMTGFTQPAPGGVVGYRAPSLVDVLRKQYAPKSPSSANKGAGFGTVSKMDAEGNVTTGVTTKPGDRPAVPTNQNVIPPQKAGPVQGNKTTAVPPAPRPAQSNVSAPPMTPLPPVPGGKPLQDRVSREITEPQPSRTGIQPASPSIQEQLPALRAPKINPGILRSPPTLPGPPRADFQPLGGAPQVAPPPAAQTGIPSLGPGYMGLPQGAPSGMPLPPPAGGAGENPLVRAIMGQPGGGAPPAASRSPQRARPPVPGVDGLPGGAPIGPATTGGFVQNQPMGFSNTISSQNAMSAAQGKELALTMLKSRGLDDTRAGAALTAVAGAMAADPNISGDIGQALGIPELAGVTFDRLRMGARMAGIDLQSMLPAAPPPAAPAPPPVVQASAPATGPAAAPAPAVKSGKGMDAARWAMGYLEQKGYPRHVAAALVGNMYQESAFSPDVISGQRRGDNGTAWGVGQWRGTRQQALKNYASSTGRDWRNLDVQLDFLDQELKSSERGTWERLQKAGNATEAAGIATSYWRPQGWTAGGDPRRVNGYNTRAGIAAQLAGENFTPEQLMAMAPPRSDRHNAGAGPYTAPGSEGAAPPTPPTFEQLMAQTGKRKGGWSPPDMSFLAQAPIPPGEEVPLSAVIPAQALDPLHAAPGAMVQRSPDGGVRVSYSGEAARMLEQMWLRPSFDFTAGA